MDKIELKNMIEKVKNESGKLLVILDRERNEIVSIKDVTDDAFFRVFQRYNIEKNETGKVDEKFEEDFCRPYRFYDIDLLKTIVAELEILGYSITEGDKKEILKISNHVRYQEGSVGVVGDYIIYAGKPKRRRSDYFCDCGAIEKMGYNISVNNVVFRFCTNCFIDFMSSKELKSRLFIN